MQNKSYASKKNFVHRYPRTFIVIGVSLSLCIMFSKPIYDVIFVPVEQRRSKIISEKLS